jgi:sialic acid synthase SpsE
MLDKTIEFDGNTINSSSSPFVIAEIGSNFNQDIDVAKKLIRVAKDSNANAVKFQLFNSEELYPKKDGLYDIFKSVELNPDWIPELKSYSDDLNISFMASCFDRKSVDVIEQNNILAHKIASSETTNLNLLAYLASKNKPLFISTGMCNFIDIEEALNVCIETGNTQVCLLQCTAQYPLDISNANLCVIPEFINRYKCNVGFSDHSTSNVQAITSVGLGAKVFEKHITLDKTSKGPDHFYAAEPEEFKNYVLQIHEAYKSLGSSKKEMTENERKEGRRDGLYYKNSLSKGDMLSDANIEIKRPAVEIRSRYYNLIKGSKLKIDVKSGDAIRWEDVKF